MTAPNPWRCPRAAPQLGMGGKGKVPRPEPTAIRLQSSNCPPKGWRHIPLAGLTGGTDSAFASFEAIPEIFACGAALDPPGRQGGQWGGLGQMGHWAKSSVRPRGPVEGLVGADIRPMVAAWGGGDRFHSE